MVLFFRRKLHKATLFHMAELEYDGNKVAFDIHGNGEKVLVAFHGFGQSKAHLGALAQSLGDQYTVFVLDLFFHGSSYWSRGEQPLTKEYWREIFEKFLEDQRIDRFSLIGYSLGGKFVLAILDSLPTRIDQIFLVSPDGIKSNLWYDLATYPAWCRVIFKSFISSPNPFFLVLKLFEQLSLLDAGLLKFTRTQMNTYQGRQRVYCSWVIFRLFKFKLNRICQKINSHNIAVVIFLGKHDRVIPIQSLREFQSRLDQCEQKILDCGHSEMINQVAQYYLDHP